MAEIDITPKLLELVGEKKYDLSRFRQKIQAEVLSKIDEGNPDKDEFISQIKKDDETYKLFQRLADVESDYLTRLDCVGSFDKRGERIGDGEISREDIKNFDSLKGHKKDGEITEEDFSSDISSKTLGGGNLNTLETMLANGETPYDEKVQTLVEELIKQEEKDCKNKLEKLTLNPPDGIKSDPKLLEQFIEELKKQIKDLEERPIQKKIQDLIIRWDRDLAHITAHTTGKCSDACMEMLFSGYADNPLDLANPWKNHTPVITRAAYTKLKDNLANVIAKQQAGKVRQGLSITRRNELKNNPTALSIEIASINIDATLKINSQTSKEYDERLQSIDKKIKGNEEEYRRLISSNNLNDFSPASEIIEYAQKISKAQHDVNYYRSRRLENAIEACHKQTKNALTYYWYKTYKESNEFRLYLRNLNNATTDDIAFLIRDLQHKQKLLDEKFHELRDLVLDEKWKGGKDREEKLRKAIGEYSSLVEQFGGKSSGISKYYNNSVIENTEIDCTASWFPVAKQMKLPYVRFVDIEYFNDKYNDKYKILSP